VAGHLELLQTSLWERDGRKDTLGSPQGEVRGLLKRYILKFPAVPLEALLRKVDPRLLTFPFRLKTCTDLFTTYPKLNIRWFLGIKSTPSGS